MFYADSNSEHEWDKQAFCPKALAKAMKSITSALRGRLCNPSYVAVHCNLDTIAEIRRRIKLDITRKKDDDITLNEEKVSAVK